jgi:hydroxymethylpyrimidine pyrophosphatase-like HAD family hydrolase
MKEEREKKSYSTFLKENEGKIVFLLIILFFIFIMIFSKFKKEEYNNKIKNYNDKTIGITSSIKNHGKTSDLRYYFYYKNQRFVSESNENNFSEKDLKKFFNVVFDKKNPENSHIYLNEEIQPDSIALTKAGFKYVTYYDYDIPTNTYIKKHKWE